MPMDIAVLCEDCLLTPWTNQLARHSGGQLTPRDHARYHASCTDDRLITDVGHDDASGPDPAILTDDHTAGLSRLVANRRIQAIKCMGIWSRGNLHARTEQGVLTDRDQTELAIGPDVHMLAKAGIGF